MRIYRLIRAHHGTRILLPAARRGLLALGLTVALLGMVEPARAGGLTIELNKAADNASGICQASLLVQNGIGATLDRFSIDLYVFDADEVAVSRLLVDLAPLPAGRTTAFTLPLGRGCATIGKLLIAGIASCRTTDKSIPDCMAGLETRSRATFAVVR
jgi:hypothetical protein